MKKDDERVMEKEKRVRRVEWVDALKFIGIFFIYIAHFAESSGKICLYAYAFHVPMFFLIAGFFSLKHRDDSFVYYIINKIKTLLVPYFVFGFLTIFVLTLQANYVPFSIRKVILDLLMGMRNQMFASPLWFFPCLFLVEVFFEGLLKLLKNKWFVFITCLILFLMAEKFFYQDYVVLPRLWFSADAGLNYLLYYAIGAVSFDGLSKFSFSSEKLWKKILCIFLFTVSTLFAVVVFFDKQAIIKNVFLVLPFGKSCYEVFVALTLIFVHIVIAKQVVKFKLICDMGKNTLWFCGNEVILKTVVPAVLSTFGLYYSLNSPLHTVIYCFALLVIGEKVLIPVEKKLFSNLFATYKKKV